MELIAWIFGLFSFFGASWAILRHPSWGAKILGLSAPLVYLTGMSGVYHVLTTGKPVAAAFVAHGALNSFLLTLFLILLPLGAGVLGVIFCLASESARTRSRIAEVMKRIRAAQAQPQGPYR